MMGTKRKKFVMAITNPIALLMNFLYGDIVSFFLFQVKMRASSIAKTIKE
jgi:hypothetical protein